MEYGFCKYGDKCQFAHGKDQLRQTQKHPKYKTEKCKSFWATGSCRYGTRCKFLHDEQFDTNGQIIEKDPYQYPSTSHPVPVQPRVQYQEPYYPEYKYPPMYNNPNSFKQSPLQQIPQPSLMIPAFYPNPNSIYETISNTQQSAIQQTQSPPLGLISEPYNNYEQLYEYIYCIYLYIIRMNYEMYQQQQQQQQPDSNIDPKLLSSSPLPDLTWEELQQTSQSSLLSNSGNNTNTSPSPVSPPLTGIPSSSSLVGSNNNNNNNVMSPPLQSNNNNTKTSHPPLIPGRKYGITQDTLHNYGYQTAGTYEARKSSWGPDTMLTSEEMVGVNRKRTWPMRSIREDDCCLSEDMENMSINPASSGDEMMMYMDDGSRYNPITGTRLPVFLKLKADSPPPPPPSSSSTSSSSTLPVPLPSQPYSLPVVIQSPPNSSRTINSAVSSPSKSGNNNNSGNGGDNQNTNQQQSYPLF